MYPIHTSRGGAGEAVVGRVRVFAGRLVWRWRQRLGLLVVAVNGSVNEPIGRRSICARFSQLGTNRWLLAHCPPPHGNARALNGIPIESYLGLELWTSYLPTYTVQTWNILYEWNGISGIGCCNCCCAGKPRRDGAAIYDCDAKDEIKSLGMWCVCKPQG